MLTFLLFGELSIACLSGLIAGAIPPAALAVYDAKRKAMFLDQFVDVLVMLSNSLRAGFNMSQAVRIVADEMPTPASEEFACIRRECELGASLDVAFDRLGDRMPSESVRIFVTAVNVSLRSGGDITKVFDNIVTAIRERERVEQRVRTMTSEARMQGYVIAAMPLGVLLGCWFWKPEAVLWMLQSPKGMLLLFLGLGLNVVGLALMSKLSKAKV